MKKILSVFVSVLVLCLMLSVAASATGTIVDVQVKNLEAPIAGNLPDYDVDFSNSSLKLSDRGIVWFNHETGWDMDPGQTFVEGNSYRVMIYITVESGYEFRVQDNGKPDLNTALNNISEDIQVYGDENEILIQYDFDPCEKVKEITEIEINGFQEPEIGAKVNFNAVEGDGFYSNGNVSPFKNGIKWYDETEKKSVIYLSSTGYFAKDHVYSAQINLKSDYAHIFSEEATATINGKQAEVEYISEDYINIRYTFDACDIGKTEKITTQQSTSNITLNWTPVTGADGYRVYQKTGKGWKNLGNTTKITAIINKLTAGTKYSFAVKAGKIIDGQVVWATDYTVIDTATKTVAPAKITAEQNTGTIKLSWTKCAGATGYRIYYKSGNTWKVSVSTTGALSHTYKNLKAGAKYTFAVRPYIKNGNNVIWSDYKEFTTATKPAAPVSSLASTSKGKITLSWSAVNGADGYQVYYSVNGGAYKLYKTYGSVQNLTFSNLKSGAKYTFAVRAGIKTSGGNIFGGYTPVTVTVK